MPTLKKRRFVVENAVVVPPSGGTGGGTNNPLPGEFSFTLATQSKTSAGIRNSAGTLIRTLWGNVVKPAGTVKGVWDGKFDNGSQAPDGTYTWEANSNNITYEWEGVIGNTSSQKSGGGILHGYGFMQDMCIVGNFIYPATGYNEAACTRMKIPLSNPTSKDYILPAFGGTSLKTKINCTDGTRVYWADIDPYNISNSWVMATNVSDDLQYIFSSGVQHLPTYQVSPDPEVIYYTSVIDLVTTGNEITGMAVQNSGNNFLFVAHKSLNVIKVFNKLTGSFVASITKAGVKAVATDISNNLWVIFNTNTIEKYTVSAAGSITSTLLSFTGDADPVSINTSLDGTLAVVCDANSHQAKAYSNSTGALTWTLGQLNGYKNNSTVANDKFAINPEAAFVIFQSDGSFWINDFGNNRCQHFTSGRTFVNNIAYLPVTYIVNNPKAEPNRIFAGYLEYEVNYALPLSPTNNSWILKRNWSGNIPAGYDARSSFRNVETLSNGRTYSTVRDGIGQGQVVELVNGSGLRYTGQTMHPTEVQLYPDGSIMTQTGGFPVPITQYWYRKPLTGFNNVGDPIWGSDILVESIYVPNDTAPAWKGNGEEYRPGEITDSGVRLTFYGGLNSAIPFETYHLGGVKSGVYVFKTGISTNERYRGDFPSDPSVFDIGNNVSDFAGGVAIAVKNFIFQTYHGEFWQSGQVNVINVFNDKGLPLGQFGTSTGSYKEGYPEMAGNAFSMHLVEIGTDLYLYHNDEFYHSGIHRWKLSNLNSIVNYGSNIPYPTGYVPVVDAGDLMYGLIGHSDNMPNNSAGWQRSPITNDSNLVVQTSILSYNKAYSKDIQATYYNQNIAYVKKDLGTTNSMASWKVSGYISWQKGQPNFTNSTGGAFFNIKDNTGKIIASLRWQTAYGADTSNIAFNVTNIKSAADNSAAATTFFEQDYPFTTKYFEVSVAAGVMTLKYDTITITSNVFESGANMNFPKTVGFDFNYNSVGTTKKINVQELRFDIPVML